LIQAFKFKINWKHR